MMFYEEQNAAGAFSGRLCRREMAEASLRSIYEKGGYRKYRLGGFEEYGLYLENRAFLASEQVITFNDMDGRLLALRPDVTLSIVKNVRPNGGPERLYYNERVYRAEKDINSYREIGQMGLEYIGDVDAAACAETVALALCSLKAISLDYRLYVSDMGFVAGLLDELALSNGDREKALSALRDKNVPELSEIDPTGSLSAVARLFGPFGETLETARGMAANDAMRGALSDLQALYEQVGDDVLLDFSMINDLTYYNGVIMRGYINGVPNHILAGGRYDLLMRRFHKNCGAIGFAIYLDELEKAADERAADCMLNVALPKGRLGDSVYKLLAQSGYDCGAINNDRRLVFENPEAGVRYFLVKPSDVAIYVEHGAADVGIVGKDILEETRPDVYELLDLGLGRCRMCESGKKDFADDFDRTLRAATKYINIAKRYYAKRGREVELIHLNGSIELAPLLGLSDVIVDIVESGATLKENDLVVLDEFMDISARFIANRAAFKFKQAAIAAMAKKLAEATK